MQTSVESTEKHTVKLTVEIRRTNYSKELGAPLPEHREPGQGSGVP